MVSVAEEHFFRGLMGVFFEFVDSKIGGRTSIRSTLRAGLRVLVSRVEPP